MTQSDIPPFGQRLIHLTAGPDLAETIIGDLQEQMHSQSAPQRWFWTQFLTSAFSLLMMQARAVSRRDWWLHASAILGAFVAIDIWEHGVARHVSWPIAKELLSVSPLSTGDTCRAVYVAVYGAFALGLMVGFYRSTHVWKRTEHCRVWQILALGIIASIPVIGLIIEPLPTDGALWFRLLQLGTVWAIAMVFVSTSKLRARPAI